jgi:hypothetical protein
MVGTTGTWLNLVDKAVILAISIEFPEVSFPEHLWYHFGNLHDKDGTPNRREEWTFGIDERLFDLLRAPIAGCPLAHGTRALWEEAPRV